MTYLDGAKEGDSKINRSGCHYENALSGGVLYSVSERYGKARILFVLT